MTNIRREGNVHIRFKSIKIQLKWFKTQLKWIQDKQQIAIPDKRDIPSTYGKSQMNYLVDITGQVTYHENQQIKKIHQYLQNVIST